MTPRETYHQAKIDHFVRRASEYVRMGRWTVARKTVDAIFTLDPTNGEGGALRAQIDGALTDLAHRHNGNGHNGLEGNGNGNARTKRGELVLCVDQDERVLTGLSTTLRRHGYRYYGAASYDEATEAMSNLAADLVVSEVNFDTGARGFDLFLWMRSVPSFKHVPFLFHATRIDRDILIAGKRFGVDDFIVKPADGEVIAAAITQTLARRKQPDFAK
jgi:PleD family two-component response regulator